MFNFSAVSVVCVALCMCFTCKQLLFSFDAGASLIIILHLQELTIE